MLDFTFRIDITGIQLAYIGSGWNGNGTYYFDDDLHMSAGRFLQTTLAAHQACGVEVFSIE
jgi:hypothetical protein